MLTGIFADMAAPVWVVAAPCLAIPAIALFFAAVIWASRWPRSPHEEDEHRRR